MTAGARPIGAMVRIHVDSDELIGRGEYLQTATGRAYRVVSGYIQQRGKWRGRQHLACLVADEIPAGVRVHQLRWYPRKKRR